MYRNKRRFKLILHWTPGEHDTEMMEACYLILCRYIKAQKNCCVCGKSKTMERVKRLVLIYRSRRKWEDLDFKKLTFLNEQKEESRAVVKYRPCCIRWMEMVFKTYSSMWC